MLVLMEQNATPDMIRRVCEEIEKMGFSAHSIVDPVRTAIGIDSRNGALDTEAIRKMAGVEDIVKGSDSLKLVSREHRPGDSVIKIGEVTFGEGYFPVIAGPCSLENRDQAFRIAEIVARNGVKIFRGGAFKPRTSPYSFQGLGDEGLRILADIRQRFNLLTITEALDVEHVDAVADAADIVQVGSRNMQNFSLLRKVGKVTRPVLLKRGMAATIHEFLCSAEYILNEGNERVILCERGVRMVANTSHNLLDLSSIVDIKRRSHLPIIADPSHASERHYRVGPLSRAALAAGAHGLMIEVHHSPAHALSDGAQALTPDEFEKLMLELRKISNALDITLL